MKCQALFSLKINEENMHFSKFHFIWNAKPYFLWKLMKKTCISGCRLLLWWPFLSRFNLLFTKTNKRYVHKYWLYPVSGYNDVKDKNNRCFCCSCLLFVCVFLLFITKTCLYNFDPLKPHFYIVKLGFTEVYIIFLISAKKHRMWVLVRTASSRRF